MKNRKLKKKQAEHLREWREKNWYNKCATMDPDDVTIQILSKTKPHRPVGTVKKIPPFPTRKFLNDT